MRRFTIGLACCVVGVLLYAANWLGAAANVPQVTQWSGSRLGAAYAVVGYQPLVIGVVLFVAGVVLVIWAAVDPHGQSSGWRDGVMKTVGFSDTSADTSPKSPHDEDAPKVARTDSDRQ